MRSLLPSLPYLLARRYSLERNFAEDEDDDTATMVAKESVAINPVERLADVQCLVALSEKLA